MFFTSKNRRTRAHTRYGRSPLLSNKPSRTRNRKSFSIPNISMPSLANIKLTLLALTLLVIVGAGLYLFVFSSHFKVTKIDIQYDELQSEDSEIAGYFEELKGKNILFVNTDGIIEQIRSAHPELQEITAKKNLPSTIQIHFSEFPIIANIQIIEDGKTITHVLVNSIGMPVAGGTDNPNLPYIRIIHETPKPKDQIQGKDHLTPDSPKPTPAIAPTPAAAPAPEALPAPTETIGATPAATTGTGTAGTPPTSTTSPTGTTVASTDPAGTSAPGITPQSAALPASDVVPEVPAIDPTKPIISAENLSYILHATSYFEEKFGMKIRETDFIIKARELHIKTEKNFTIWLDTQIPFERQFLKLKKAMATIDIYKVALEYIDLRIAGASGEKVIFKRKK